MAEPDTQRHLARVLARNAPWSIPTIAVFMLFMQPAIFPTHAVGNDALTQRVSSLEASFVDLNTRQRIDQAEVMKMLIDVRSAVSRIEGSLGRVP